MERNFTKEQENSKKEDRRESLDGTQNESKREEDEPKKELMEERREFEEDLGQDKRKLQQIEASDEKLLKELSYYHGYLPRDDLTQILRQDGDFLLRLTEVDSGGNGRHLIISCLTSLSVVERESMQGSINPDQLKLRHIVVHRLMGQFRLDDKNIFPTIKDMIKFCMDVGHVTKAGRIRLKRGIPLQQWEYAHEELQLGTILGSGQYGEVREGELTKKKNKRKVRVAVKLGKDHASREDKSKEKIKEFMKEARIMKFLRHKNIVRLYGVLVLEQPIGIILELVDGGALDSYLRKFDSLIESREKIQMCSGAANGLAYLHSQRILHRDVAARNCLYSSDKTIKISDFGLSKVMEQTDAEYKLTSGKKFPIKWLAPETIMEKVFSTKTDVYSYGVLAWEIFSNGKDPYANEKNTDVKARVIVGNFLEMPFDTPPALAEFISTKVFVLDRKKRVTMGEVGRFMENLLFESKMRSIQAEISNMKSDSTLKTSRESVEDGSTYGSGSKLNSNSEARDKSSGYKIVKSTVGSELVKKGEGKKKEKARKRKSDGTKKSALSRNKFSKAS